jgi:soluble lytic murein transglycosylase-like protein/tetratricopeptide (TPR) repeat protein
LVATSKSCVYVVLLFLLCSSTAQAEPPEHVASVHLNAGKALYHRHQFPAAIVELNAALEAQGTAATSRDTRHLLGLSQFAVGDYDGAAESFRAAIEHGVGPHKTVLLDVLRYRLGESLRKLKKYDEAAVEFGLVTRDKMSPHRQEAARLVAKMADLAGHSERALEGYSNFVRRWPDSPRGRDVRLRIAHIELGQGKTRRAILRFKSIQRKAPISRAGQEANKALKKLVKEGSVLARRDSPAEQLAHLEWLLSERRFEEALEPAKHFHEAIQGVHRRPERIRILELLARIYEQTRREKDALVTHGKIQKLSGVKLGLEKRARLMALSGDYEGGERMLLKRFRGKKSRLYWRKLADFRYTFGKYESAYSAYLKGMSPAWHKASRKGKKRLTPRMAWSLLAMDRASEVVDFFRTRRGKNARERMGMRYWYGRSLELSGEVSKALEVFDKLSGKHPYKYYGILAHSRSLEVRRKEKAEAQRGNEDSALPGSTVQWSSNALRPAYNEAPKPVSEKTRLDAVAELALKWGKLAPEAYRAQELAGLGFHDAALVEVRVVDMDLRSGRRGLGNLVGRARADLLDNRSDKRGRGGARIGDGGRRDRKEARRFLRNGAQIRHTVRKVQVAYGDYYGIRREAFERRNLRRESPTEQELALWKRAYPIAYPDMVNVFSEHHAVPGYFLYSIMSVESTFHPHPVSVANAYGLLQVIPRTGRRLATELNYSEFSPEILLKPEVSVYFGSYYLGKLLEKFQGQELLAAAAYNAGPHRIESWIRANPNRPMDLFVENIPYRESRGYARSVLERIAHYRRLYHGEERIYASNHLNPDCLVHPNY